jgi:hypothetical protein
MLHFKSRDRARGMTSGRVGSGALFGDWERGGLDRGQRIILRENLNSKDAACHVSAPLDEADARIEGGVQQRTPQFCGGYSECELTSTRDACSRHLQAIAAAASHFERSSIAVWSLAQHADGLEYAERQR